MRRLAIMVLLIVGTMVPGRGTVAFLTSSTASASNTFTAGTVEIADVPATALVTFSNMYPGAAVYGNVTVRNAGTVSLFYAVGTTSTNGTLTNGLKVHVKRGLTANCTASGFASLTDDVQGGETALGSVAGTLAYVLGDASVSSNIYNRTLAPTATDEPLCVRVRLPEDASTTLQGLSTDVTFKFIGVQKSGL